MSGRPVCDAERAGLMEAFDEMRGTLNGRPAVVLGRLEDFPTVATLDGSGLAVEYSWPAIRRAVRRAKATGRPPCLST